jgi:hypothetical protein
VDIAADSPPSGQVFDQWTGDVSHVADVNASQTTVTMPEADVAVTATYKDEQVLPDPTLITSPQEGDILTEGTEITLTAEGSNLRWSYDANSDKLGEIDIGEGNSVTFSVPTNVSGPMTITIFCTGDNGSDQVECSISQTTRVAAHGTGHRDGTGVSRNAYGAGAMIRFRLVSTQRVILEVYDASGERVRALVDRRFAGGFHSITWDGRNALGTPVAGGMYTIVLRTDAGTESWKTVVRR